eukprot:255681-Amphidinium_carterae.1
MIIHGRAWNLIRPASIQKFPGTNQSLCKNGSGDAGGISISVMTSIRDALDEAQYLAACAHGKAVSTSHSEDVVAVATGHVRNTWWLQPVWMDTFPCVHAIITWNKSLARVFPGCVHTGNKCAPNKVAWLRRPWPMPVNRIGEAKNPGPHVCTCNPGGWSRAEGLLSMGHDLILLQETFLLQSKIPGAARMASENGYFSSFIPARGTAGRPSGGLASLCKQAVPQQRMEDGKQWEAGRWARLVPRFQVAAACY